MTKEQLLAEFEDLLRTMPPRQSLNNFSDDILAWRGRAAALIEAWDLSKTIALGSALARIDNGGSREYDIGQRSLVSLLHQARFALRSETVGPLNVVIAEGGVFDYFDEIRKVIETARRDILFVDRYLDAEFVSQYLPHVADGVTIRLLGRDKIKQLEPAVRAFAAQHNAAIQVRSAPNFHDRLVFIDGGECYLSGGSFKDGPRKAPVTLTQISDAVGPTLSVYEGIWATANVHI